MNYRVVTPFALKTKLGEVSLAKGQIVTISETKASKLISEGKILPIQDMNPDRYPCKRCGRLAERFCYDIEHREYPYCNWFCLRCEPYLEQGLN